METSFTNRINFIVEYDTNEYIWVSNKKKYEEKQF
jgi:hypothetical protein